jgi:DNA-binding transcriptional regulator YiaG
MTFAEQLKSERDRLGLSQDQAAALIETSKRTYTDWESGRTVPLPVAQEGALARMRGRKK